MVFGIVDKIVIVLAHMRGTYSTCPNQHLVPALRDRVRICSLKCSVTAALNPLP